MLNLLKISIIIPCRNEEKFISGCLDSILQQNYPQDKLEILLADGMSTDRTIEILKDYAKRYSTIRWFENQKRIVPTGLNILIEQAKGELIIRMDAHNEYPRDYVLKCVKYMKEYNVDNVGGLWVTRPGANTIQAKAIAVAVSSPFGVGNAHYRIGVKEPKYVDTVPFGCYKRTIFEKIGLFDEELIRSQDAEFNLRLIKSGGKILLAPDIVSYYYARENLQKLAKMYAQYGYFKAFTVTKLGKVLTLRQIIPAFFMFSLMFLALLAIFFKVFLWLLIFDVGLYLAMNVSFALKLSLKEGLILFPFLIWTFIVIHFVFGFNYLRGIWDFWILKKHLKHKIIDAPLTR